MALKLWNVTEFSHRHCAVQARLLVGGTLALCQGPLRHKGAPR